MESLLISPWAVGVHIWWCCSAQRSEKREIQCSPWECYLGCCCTSHLGRREGRRKRNKKIITLSYHVHFSHATFTPCTLFVIKFCGSIDSHSQDKIAIQLLQVSHVPIFNLKKLHFVDISLERMNIMIYWWCYFTKKFAFSKNCPQYIIRKLNSSSVTISFNKYLTLLNKANVVFVTFMF